MEITPNLISHHDPEIGKDQKFPPLTQKAHNYEQETKLASKITSNLPKKKKKSKITSTYDTPNLEKAYSCNYDLESQSYLVSKSRNYNTSPQSLASNSNKQPQALNHPTTPNTGGIFVLWTSDIIGEIINQTRQEIHMKFKVSRLAPSLGYNSSRTNLKHENYKI